MTTNAQVQTFAHNGGGKRKHATTADELLIHSSSVGRRNACTQELAVGACTYYLAPPRAQALRHDGNVLVGNVPGSQLAWLAPSVAVGRRSPVVSAWIGRAFFAAERASSSAWVHHEGSSLRCLRQPM